MQDFALHLVILFLFFEQPEFLGQRPHLRSLLALELVSQVLVELVLPPHEDVLFPQLLGFLQLLRPALLKGTQLASQFPQFFLQQLIALLEAGFVRGKSLHLVAEPVELIAFGVCILDFLLKLFVKSVVVCLEDLNLLEKNLIFL